jgi:hypothetical protein
MSRGGIWLLRCIGAFALAALVLVVFEAMRAPAWLPVPDLATLELTVVAALGVTATCVVARGRRAFELDTWTRTPGLRGWAERIVLLWCASLAATLGALPGLALGLGPPGLWPLALVALAMLVARTFGAELARRVAWLLCTSYGLTAALSLVVVRHVF